MPKSVTRWRPDICDCVVVATYDATNKAPPDSVRVEYKCAAHAAISDKDLYTELLVDCQKRGWYVLPALKTYLGLPPEGYIRDQVWLDANRVMHIKPLEFINGTAVTPITINAAQKIAAQSAIDASVGAGKVKLE